MKLKLVETIIVVFIVAVIALIDYGGWRIERWYHWKFSYGPKVEERIRQVEKRQTDLERRIEQLEKAK